MDIAYCCFRCIYSICKKDEQPCCSCTDKSDFIIKALYDEKLQLIADSQGVTKV